MYVKAGNQINFQSAKMYDVCYRVPEHIAEQLGLVGETAEDPGSTVRISKNESRDRYFYELRMDGKELKIIECEMQKQGYRKISVPGIWNAISRYCKRHNKPFPEVR